MHNRQTFGYTFLFCSVHPQLLEGALRRRAVGQLKASGISLPKMERRGCWPAGVGEAWTQQGTRGHYSSHGSARQWNRDGECNQPLLQKASLGTVGHVNHYQIKMLQKWPPDCPSERRIGGVLGILSHTAVWDLWGSQRSKPPRLMAANSLRPE